MQDLEEHAPPKASQELVLNTEAKVEIAHL
jgi:DNA repair exonuclease SbcCD ATPase subunit